MMVKEAQLCVRVLISPNNEKENGGELFQCKGSVVN